jgi:predicted  nucleic acid-binding Zn-ribbon protein
MTWFRRPPARRPHPDPARELELRRILDLQDGITRRARLIAQYRQAIADLYDTAQDETSIKRIEIYLGEITVLHQRIADAEAEIAGVHEQIAALQEKIPPDDLAYLS